VRVAELFERGALGVELQEPGMPLMPETPPLPEGRGRAIAHFQDRESASEAARSLGAEPPVEVPEQDWSVAWRRHHTRGRSVRARGSTLPGSARRSPGSRSRSIPAWRSAPAAIRPPRSASSAATSCLPNFPGHRLGETPVLEELDFDGSEVPTRDALERLGPG